MTGDLIMKRLLIFLTIALGFFLLTCSPGEQDKSEIVAKINDYSLTLDDFHHQLAAEAEFQTAAAVDINFRKNLLDQIIRKELLIQEAKKLEFDRKENFIRTIETYWEATLIRDILNFKAKEFENRVVVTKEDIVSYYEELSKQGVLPPLSDLEEALGHEIKEKKKSEILEEWITGVKNSAKIDINQELLEKKR
jgi:hypothetical protein